MSKSKKNKAKSITSASTAERIEDLLSRMTLEEKAGQLNQWFNLGTDQYDQVRRGEIGSGLMNSSTAGNNRQERVFVKLVNEIQKIVVTESRLGIPLVFGLFRGQLTYFQELTGPLTV